MTLSKFLGLKIGFQGHKVASWPQKQPYLAKKSKIARISLSALAEDPTAVTLVINHSNFRLKRGFPDHKVSPDHKSGLS